MQLIPSLAPGLRLSFKSLLLCLLAACTQSSDTCDSATCLSPDCPDTACLAPRGDTACTTSVTDSGETGNSVYYDVGVTVDLSQGTGTIRNMNGLQGGPKWNAIPKMDLSADYSQAGVPLVRFPQDDGYDYALSSIFPDDQAPVDDPESYHFSDIDAMVQAVFDAGAEPMWEALYDIGENENWGGIKTQGGDPPDDPEKWADVVRHVLMHWNDGWADGYELGVRYVEFINEPVLCGGFEDDKEQIFTVYRAFADALESYENEYGHELTILGPAMALQTEDLAELDQFKESLGDWLQGRRMDVFTMHTYGDTPWEIYSNTLAFKEVADTWGMQVGNTEWNYKGLRADGTDELSLWDGVWTATGRILLEPLLDLSIIYRGPPKFLFPEMQEYFHSPYFDCQSGDCHVMPGWFSFMPFQRLAGMEGLETSWPEALTQLQGFAAMAGLDQQLAVLVSSLDWSGQVGVILENIPESLRGEQPVLFYRLRTSTTTWEPYHQQTLNLGDSALLQLPVDAPDLWFLVIG